MNAAVKPIETLLVVDAMTGQEAVGVAQAFVAAVPVTGLILTKIDGDARGGAALSISAVAGIPVKFLGTGEKTDALEVFHPDRLAGRILGMGDILTLVERAQETFDVNQAEKMEEKLRKASFTLEDMLEQLQAGPEDGPDRPDHGHDPGHGQHGRRGPGRGGPGRPQAHRGDHPGDDPGRAPRPTVLNASRRRRIAAGAGTALPEVNKLVKQFSEMQKLMKQLSGGGKRGALGGLMGNRR